MKESPPARPSNPSDIFTALVFPTSKNKINIPNIHPNGLIRFKAVNLKVVDPRYRINK